MKNWFFNVWMWVGSLVFRESIKEFGLRAYQEHVKREALAAERLDIVDAYKTVATDNETKDVKKNLKKIAQERKSLEQTLPRGVVLLGDAQHLPANPAEEKIVKELMTRAAIRKQYGDDALPDDL